MAEQANPQTREQWTREQRIKAAMAEIEQARYLLFPLSGRLVPDPPRGRTRDEVQIDAIADDLAKCMWRLEDLIDHEDPTPIDE